MQLNHHILAKRTTDSVLAKFKKGEWTCCARYGENFFRTCCNADFPSPDATFGDSKNNLIISFEFKPPTETKRGILTGLGQTIAYLQFSDLSYLIIPEMVEDYRIADHVSEIFSSIIVDKVPVGLISYKNDNPEEVNLAHNISHLSGHGVKRDNLKSGSFWAKHVDMPIPLFHLILHYAYRNRTNTKKKDAFAQCWEQRMAPKANIKKLAPKPVLDVNGQPIRSLAGTKEHIYLETTINKIKKLSPSRQEEAIERLLVKTDTLSTVDNKYTAVRKNYITFMHHVGMLDSNCQLTSEGVKMYHLGMVNGPQSSLFKDYFARMVLLDGHHIDLIYDLESLSRDYRGMEDDLTIKKIMLKEYHEKGMIKTNPGRKSKKSSSTEEKRFLKKELMLWRALGLMKKAPGKPSFAFDWQRITEVCNLPAL